MDEKGSVSGRKRFRRLVQEWGRQCPACGYCEPEITMSRHHVRPKAKGGTLLVGNVVPLCIECNRKIGDKLADFQLIDITNNPAARKELREELRHYVEESGEDVCTAIVYNNLPLNRRVTITADFPNATLPARTGQVHEVKHLDGANDEYWVRLDEPAIIRADNGSLYLDNDICVHRDEFEYLAANFSNR